MESRQQNYLPVLLLLFAALVSLTPMPFAGDMAIMPSFSLITVFYWSLLRPAQLPAITIFIAGLIIDAFAAPALGLNILILLTMRMMAIRFSSRFARQTIWFFWAGFWLMSLPCWLIFWMLASLQADRVLSMTPALLDWSFTALCYPLLHLVFTRCLAILPNVR